MSLHYRGLCCLLSVTLAFFSTFSYAQQKSPVRLIIAPANPPLSAGNNLSFTIQEAFFEGAARAAPLNVQLPHNGDQTPPRS